MTTSSQTTDAQRTVELLAAIARQLNAGGRPADTLAGVTEMLRAYWQARQVALWVHESNSTTFYRISAPRAGPTAVSSLDALPAPGPDTTRIPLEREGAPLGALEVSGAERPGAVLSIVADVLAPFLAAIELAEDLAFEVAVQSREIEDQRRFTSHIIDSLPVGLYVVDRDYRIQMWNRKREAGTQGMRREQVVGRRVFEVLTRQNADELRSEFDRVFESGETMRQEIDAPVDGVRRYYRITKIPMRLDGETVSHVITIGEDVTDWRGIQAQILQSEKLAAIGQLAAGIMHEINNPLATIGACVAAMDGRLPTDGPGGAVVQEYLEIIEKEVERCTKIVDGLLDFSRPKGSAKAPIALNALVHDASFLLKHHPRFKQITLAVDLDPELPTAMANAEQLVQVLVALMLNAVDAMAQGGRLTVHTARSRVRDDEVVIEVEDTGHGIARVDQSRIFEPFYTTKAPGRGTGLGLSICYGIVEEHRGRLECESQEGLGTTFRVYLPVAG